MAQALKPGDRVQIFDRTLMDEITGTVISVRQNMWEQKVLVQWDDEPDVRRELVGEHLHLAKVTS